ncbi:hypothetical protein B7Z17_03900, partial [Candidatus Saccharibacteria bacterium 32-49-10]
AELIRQGVLPQVDYAIIETGLGGRLDATNTIRRADKICVITNIGLDHMHILGDTVEQIASEKAGIIRQGNHVFTIEQTDSILDVFSQRCHEVGATMEIIGVESSLVPPYLPKFNAPNISLAYAVCEYVSKQDNLTLTPDIQFKAPPGRFEIFTINDQTIILDGAHNPQKCSALVQALEETGIYDADFILAFKDAPGKDIQQFLAQIKPFAVSYTLTHFELGMDQKKIVSIDSQIVASYLSDVDDNAVEVLNNPSEALNSILSKHLSRTVVITGSLYLVSVVREYVVQLQSRAVT